MFEDKTVESIKSEILENMEDFETRDGSFANDMASPCAYAIWNLYKQLEALLPIVFIDETSGEYIDKTAAEYGITRKPGTKATGTVSVFSTPYTEIPKGTMFLTESGMEFISTVEVPPDGLSENSVEVEAVEPGTEYNLPENSISRMLYETPTFYVLSSTATTGGADAESDSALVERINQFRRRPATSGNKNHYEQWALEVDGVGAAKVTPLASGAGTVGILIVDENKSPVDAEVVTACAEHIEEVRPIGADVTVTSATELTVNVSVTITATETTGIQDNFETALTQYLYDIAFEKDTVVLNEIGALLMDIENVTDYSLLKINGSASNLSINSSEVPKLGTVTITWS